MSQILIGQRYMSIAEPELGLGIVAEVEDKALVVNYPASDEIRRYGRRTAPLKRIQFEIGDDISTTDGVSFTIEKVVTSDTGLLVYMGDLSQNEDHLILECDVSGSINFHRPEEKLLNVLADKSSLFQLRYETFQHRAWLASHHARGLIGARISLIEHQYYLADTITKRAHPRVLLADEVGLGKTIETGLILHKLLITARAQRVLIVTPNTLNFQWFIEMLRKYNLQFSIINEQTELDLRVNSFDENNLVITSTEFLKQSEFAREQALSADWDLLIVDEAHKLDWSQDNASDEYTIIEKLAALANGLLLLTATPEIHGSEQHFSHLKLIDPDRFYSLEEYLKEEKSYKAAAEKARDLIDNKNLSIDDDEIKELIDRHGPGRVYFRNTRDAIDKDHRFFPKRHLKSYPLTLALENQDDADSDSYEAKLLWLIEFLKDHQNEKVLLICDSKEKVLRIENDLKHQSVGNKIGVFHEDLSLMARDRQAAYFREEGGSNILLCSEIGSEGRNFQFCQDLILFDLPKLPDLLEQRIGRLDRIGQKENIYIHVPYTTHTNEEYLFNWYDKTFQAFITSIKGATQINQKYFDQYKQASQSTSQRAKIIEKAKQDFIDLNKSFQQGRDILIELNSFHKEKAEKLVNTIKEIDESPILKTYLENVFSHFGVDIEDLDEHSQYIRPSDNMFIPHFPHLPDEGFSYTFNRQLSLEREELIFMSWDHPLVIGAMELICGEEFGNSTLVVRKNQKVRHFLECFYLLESNAPKSLEIGRFLPPTIIRVLIDLEGNDFSQKWEKATLDEKLEDAPNEIAHKVSKYSKQKIKELLKQAKKIALSKQEQSINNALANASRFYSQEIERLKKLQTVNSMISDGEIELLSKKRENTVKAIEGASLGMDSLRFIY